MCFLWPLIIPLMHVSLIASYPIFLSLGMHPRDQRVCSSSSLSCYYSHKSLAHSVELEHPHLSNPTLDTTRVSGIRRTKKGFLTQMMVVPGCPHQPSTTTFRQREVRAEECVSQLEMYLRLRRLLVDTYHWDWLQGILTHAQN